MIDDYLGTTIYGDRLPLELADSAIEVSAVKKRLSAMGFKPSVAGENKSWDRRDGGRIARITLPDGINGNDYGLVLTIQGYTSPDRDPKSFELGKNINLDLAQADVLGQMTDLFRKKEAPDLR